MLLGSNFHKLTSVSTTFNGEERFACQIVKAIYKSGFWKGGEDEEKLRAYKILKK
jgi:hypothetical protein